MKLRPHFKSVYVVILVVTALAAPLPAQQEVADEYVNNHNLKGVVPFGSYAFDAPDSVNVGTGSAEVLIPLFTRTGRGLDFSRALTYSSKIWSREITTLPTPTQSGVATMTVKRDTFKILGAFGELAWREDIVPCPSQLPPPGPGGGGPTQRFAAQSSGLAELTIRSNFAYTTASGSTVRFPNRTVRQSNGEVTCEELEDLKQETGLSETGMMTLETPSAQASDYTLRFADGSTEMISGNSGGGFKRTDSNGNFIQGEVDTLSRSFSRTGTVSTDITLGYHDSQGLQRNFVLRYSNHAVNPAFPSASCPLGGSWVIQAPATTLTVLDEVELPNGLEYRFSYDPVFGELTRIDLPTGGYIRYEWVTLAEFDNVPGSLDGPLCRIDSRRVSKRIVSPDGTAGSEETWNYSYSLQSSSPFRYTTAATDPEGNRSVHEFDADGIHELTTELYTGFSDLERRITRTWGSSFGAVASTASTSGIVTADFQFDSRKWRVLREDVMLGDTNQVKSSETEYIIYQPAETALYPGADTRMNVLRRRFYDWGSGSRGPQIKILKTRYLHEFIPAYLEAHILDRPFNIDTFDGAGVIAARRRLRYDQRTITATSGVYGHDYSSHPSGFTVRGMVTTEQNLVISSSTWLNTRHWYDDLGNAVKTRSPRGFDTVFTYADSLSGSTACRTSAAPLRAFVSSSTNPKGHTASRSSFLCSSLTASATDANNRTTSFEYDLMDRLKAVLSPDGGEHRRYYSDLDLFAAFDGAFVFPSRTSSFPLRSKALTRIQGFQAAASTTVLDGLGRIEYAGTRNGSQTDWIRSEYDGAGRRHRISNPRTLFGESVPSAGSFSRYTETHFDGLSRPLAVTHQDGSQTVFDYPGNQSLRTDPGGRTVRSAYDGLGRLTAVREPNPSNGSLTSGFFDTFYSYDALDNLTQVGQGSQTRSFGYDSLSRLVSETHPESGTTSYGYDANSNLTDKTDARGVGVSHVHDSLDRVTFTSYSDSTPPVSYNYDTAFNGVGRPASVFDGAGDSSFSYDEVGRITTLTRTNRIPGGPSQTHTAQYDYNLTGGVEEAFYPDTRPTPWTIEYDYDDQGRQTRVLGRDAASSSLLISGYSFTYQSSGATETIFYDLNNTVEQTSYNERLQPVGRNVFLNTSPFTWMMGLSYDYAHPVTGGNDGNIWAVTDQRDSTHSMSYGYDYLNRISEVDGFNWSADYAYDRYGNRSAFFSGSLPPGVQHPPSVSFSSFTNRISGKSYDAAGNILFEDGHSLQWDAESRLKSIGNGSTAQYLYDYLGRRAVKLTATENRFYFYEASGEVIWEYLAGNPTQDLVRAFHNGKAFFENGSVGSHYLHTDHLGSPRILSSTFGAVVDCREFYTPFGQHAHECPTSDHRSDFTGKEEDHESRFTYFGARYHDPLMGRFLSPDPLLDSAKPGEPQSWNRYAYVSNNPVAFIDPNGLSKKRAIKRLLSKFTKGKSGKVSGPFSNFLKKPLKKRAKAIKRRRKTLEKHYEQNADLFNRGGRSIETERIELEVKLMERIQEQGFEAQIDDLVGELDKLFSSVGAGAALTTSLELGDTAEEILGEGLLGTGAAVIIDVVNPVGIVEDAAFVGGLIDQGLEEIGSAIIEFQLFIDRAQQRHDKPQTTSNKQ